MEPKFRCLLFLACEAFFLANSLDLLGDEIRTALLMVLGQSIDGEKVFDLLASFIAYPGLQ